LEGAVYFVTWRVHPAQTDLTPEERELVFSALRHFDDLRYKLAACVAMNDHVHVLAQPLPPFELQHLIHSWKSYTTNVLQRQFGRLGCIWQDEYMDHIIRDDYELMQKVEYTYTNPVRRWPDIVEYPWVFALGVVGWRRGAS
jgi:REP element-mobilizing transposase RayT